MMIGRGIAIGRLYGIQIRVDWGWLIIAALVTWNLRGVFTQLHPEWAPGVHWALALLAAFFFFASVLAHEMAHAVVALGEGLPVRNITLFLFGGVANIEREPPTPRAEFLIAIAGPVMSLLIGGILLTLGIGSAVINHGWDTPRRMLMAMSPAATLMVWLGSINLVLAIFNMVPGFPLDGGRVLRSLLWALMKNLRKATRLASWIGQFLALSMIAIGVVMAFGVYIPFFGTGLINGMWLVFVGWFLNNAAVQSYQQVAIQEVLGDVSVAQLMFRHAITVEPDRPIGDLVSLRMLANEDLAFPVVENGRLVGIVTSRDIRSVPKNTWQQARVQEAMTPLASLVTLSPEEDAAEAMDKLITREVAQAPVIVGDEQFVGLLRRRDISQWLQLHMERGRRGKVQAS